MFDLRYHVASLAAVFLALIIGILVGVGISSQTNVEGSERRVLEQRIEELNGRLETTAAETDLLRRRQSAADRYILESYEALMTGRLRGTQIVLLFVGPADSGLMDHVRQTISDASGPGLVRMRALELPVDAREVSRALRPELGNLALEEVGRRLGAELVRGGEIPIWDALSRVIVEEEAGGDRLQADAVVVAHTGRADDVATERLVSGLYAGLASSGVPAVGVERTAERQSRISVYERHGLSSVDCVDTDLGRVALAVLLAGGIEGRYGLKQSATDGPLPPVEALPLAPLPGG